MKITAAVLPELHAPFRIEEVELDEPQPGEVLVRIAAAGVCHTDGLAQHGDLPFPAPGVLGHEGAGIVEAVGEGADGLRVGDKVVIGWPWCGVCRNCLDGQPRYCYELGPLVAGGGRPDGSTALRRADGSPLHSHFFGQSSFATHALAQASSLVVMPPEAPVDRLGPLACGIGTGAGTIFNALQPGTGSSIVVYGVGSVGLAAVMAAVCSGATTVVAVDKHAHRLRLARELGATETVDVTKTNPVEAVKEICGPQLADFSLECTGVLEVVRQAIDSVGMRGTCALIGGAPTNAEFTVEHMTTLWGKRIVGILGGEGRSDSLITSLLALNRQGRFPYERLITTFPLSEVNEALEASYSGEVLKPLLTMS
jgi:aryl-alcohol dehydrogenase